MYLRYEPDDPSHHLVAKCWEMGDWGLSDWEIPADGRVAIVSFPGDEIGKGGVDVKKGDVVAFRSGNLLLNGSIVGLSADSVSIGDGFGGDITINLEEGMMHTLTLAVTEQWGEDVLIGPTPGNPDEPATIKRPLNPAAAQSFGNLGFGGAAIMYILILHDRLSAVEKQVAYMQSAIDDLIAAVGPVNPEKLK